LENFAAVGYSGQVAAVNPKYDEILGYPCAANLKSLPFLPEAVLVSVNRNLVVPVIEEAAELGIKAAVVFAIGFLETGEDGGARQARLVQAARDGGMAVIGPNCQGMISFVSPTPLYMGSVKPYEAGRVALVAQSGSVTTSLTNNKRGVRWSHIVSAGNEAVTDSADLLGYFVDDPATDVICLFIETVRDPERFFAECDRARETGKPVVVLKSGRTAAGAAAATAHSGALAVPDRLVDSMMRRHGVLRVDSLEELLETAIAVQSRRRPRGRRMATATGSGGQIELILDQTGPLGLVHPTFGPEASAGLRELLPDFLNVKNPLDWWGMDDYQNRLPKLVKTVIDDPQIDILLTVSDFTHYPTGDDEDEDGQLASSLDLAQQTDKLVVLLGSVDGAVPPATAESTLEAGVLTLSGLPVGLRALAHLVGFSTPLPPAAPHRAIESERIRALLSERSRPTGGLPALEILTAAGLAIPDSRLARDEDTAVELGGQIGYPVALKSGDPDLLHKTESGAVVLNLADEAAVRAAAGKLLADGAESLLVQEQIPHGAELILGLERHPELGMFVVVGLGGIWTEVIDDVVFRPVGLREGEAEDMIRTLRGFQVLDGARGSAPIDLKALVGAIEIVDAIGQEFGDDLQSLDINPLIATSSGVVAVDALVVPRSSADAADPGRSHFPDTSPPNGAS
jgi:acyl-CoA synthetase (NDP forming)